jgi:hypothetical protein
MKIKCARNLKLLKDAIQSGKLNESRKLIETIKL